MGFFGIGLLEWLILALMGWGGGDVGLPLGMPPGPEDRAMARVAPDECLYYISWATMAEPDPESPNHAERLLAEPEVRAFLLKAEQVVRKAWADGRRFDDGEESFARIFPDLLKTMLTRATAIYVEGGEAGPRGPEFTGGLICNLGDQAADLRERLEAFQASQLAVGQAETINVDGKDFFRLSMKPSPMPFHWGIHGEYLMVGIGAESIEQMQKNLASPPPKWLEKLRGSAPVERIASVAYLDLAEGLDLAEEMGRVPVREYLKMVGVNELTSYRSIAGLSEDRVITRSVLGIEGELNGIAKLADAKPLTDQDLAKIPGDATVAYCVRVRPAIVWDQVMATIKTIEPLAAERFNEGVVVVNKMAGADLRDDILEAFGDVIYLYAPSELGGVMTGWVLSLKVDDPMTLVNVERQLVQLAESTLNAAGGRQPRLNTIDFQENKIHFFSVPDDDVVVAPGWCLANGELIIGLYPQALKEHLSRDKNAAPLPSLPLVNSALRGEGEQWNHPVSLIYVEPKRLIEIVYPAVQFFGRMILGEIQDDLDIDFTIADLPTFGTLTRHLQPSVMTVSRTDEGLVWVGEHSFPTGTLGSTMPFMAGGLLPSKLINRAMAGKTQGSNNLRQLALAVHNYHDVYGGVPARYSTDETGRPLLSWRVHILPFTEQAHLYEQFHFDEPWDSEHNLKLVAQMPLMYAAPGSDPSEGKTNYLAIDVPRSLFSPPKMDGKPHQKMPVGVRFRDVTDGLSNTVMAVEVPHAARVIWTKPDDFQAPDMDPLRRLIGLWSKDEFQAAIGDGSVRTFRSPIDRKTLLNLFQVNDGNVVEIPDF